MVCLGNICRSPLAEGIAREKINERQLPWEVDSVGTGNWHVGEPPDPRSIATAATKNIDISKLRGRQINRSDIENSDVIVAMDTQNYQAVKQMAGDKQSHKVHLMMNFLYPDKNMVVPDPYFGQVDGFQEVYDLLDKACDAMIDRFVSREGLES